MPPKGRNKKKNKNKGRPGFGRTRTVHTARITSTLEGKAPTQWKELKHVLNPEFPTVYSRRPRTLSECSNLLLVYFECVIQVNQKGERWI